LITRTRHNGTKNQHPMSLRDHYQLITFKMNILGTL